jgi:hypothetical protein
MVPLWDYYIIIIIVTIIIMVITWLSGETMK